MKQLWKVISLTILLFVTACGQGVNAPDNSTTGEGHTPDESPEDEFAVDIPAKDEFEAEEVIRLFFSEQIDEEAFAGLYLEQEPDLHFVLYVQNDYPRENVREELNEYVTAPADSAENSIRVKLETAMYSLKELETVFNQLNQHYDELTVGDRPVASLVIDEMENRIELEVSDKEELNHELIEDLTAGEEEMLNINEGLLSSVDENGIPTADAHTKGTIDEIDDDGRILVDDEIYYAIDEGTIITDLEGNEKDASDLAIGDEVSVWTDHPVAFSLPAQGIATFIVNED